MPILNKDHELQNRFDTKTVKAWCFAGLCNTFGYNDNRSFFTGEIRSVSLEEKDLELCKWGLHASVRVLDALFYAPGPIVYRVKCSGQMIKEEDKFVAEHREYLWGFDATEILQKFARDCASSVIHLWDAPEVVMEYLKTGNKELAALASKEIQDNFNRKDSAVGTAWTAMWCGIPNRSKRLIGGASWHTMSKAIAATVDKRSPGAHSARVDATEAFNIQLEKLLNEGHKLQA